jgi:hypothetical protein
MHAVCCSASGFPIPLLKFYLQPLNHFYDFTLKVVCITIDDSPAKEADGQGKRKMAGCEASRKLFSSSR